MNGNIGVVVFYLLNLFSVFLMIVGGEIRDTILFAVGICLVACAFLIKLEFKLDVFFGKKLNN